MEAVAKSLPLRHEARAALMGATNSVAIPLNLIRSFESGAWGPCARAAQDLGVGEEVLTTLYVESLKWAAKALACGA
jgi:c-di-GMP-related signal transduction protein